MSIYKVAICVLFALVSGAALLGYAVYVYKKGYVWIDWLKGIKYYRKESPGLFWVGLLINGFFGMLLAIFGLIGLIRIWG